MKQTRTPRRAGSLIRDVASRFAEGSAASGTNETGRRTTGSAWRRGLGVAMVLLLMLSASAMAYNPRPITVDSLPIEARSNDSIYFTDAADTLVVSQMVSHSVDGGTHYYGVAYVGANNVFIDLSGKFIKYDINAAEGDYRHHGIIIHGLPTDITIKNGTISRDFGGAGFDRGSTIYGVYIFWADNVLIEDVDIIVDGANAIGIYNQRPQHNNVYRNVNIWCKSHSFSSREAFQSGGIKNGGGVKHYGGDPSVYNIVIENVNVHESPHFGMILGHCRGIIEACSVTVDARNVYWDTVYFDQGIYAPVGRSADNSYMYLLSDLEPGSRFVGNKGISGRNHQGARGLMTNSFYGLSTDSTYVTDNYFEVNAGPTGENPDGWLRGWRHRVDNMDYVAARNNTIIARVDGDPNTTAIGKRADVLNWTFYSYNESGPSWKNTIFENNYVVCSVLTPVSGGHISAVSAIGRVGQMTKSNGIWRNNRIESDGHIYYIGDNYNGNGGGGFVFQNDDVKFINQNKWSGARTYYAPNFEPSANWMDDVTFGGGASESDIVTQGSSEVTLERHLNVFAVGNNGEPVTNAQVTVRNNYGQTLINAPTNNTGLASGLVTYEYQSGSYSDSTNFNPFVITVSKNGDTQTLNNYTVGSNSPDGIGVFIELLNTTGDGVWDTTGMGDNGGGGGGGTQADTTAPAPVMDLGAICNPTSGTIELAWTAPGDDGMNGLATSYDLRYSPVAVSENQFASLPQVSPQPGAPKPAGQSETLAVVTPTAEGRHFFYLRASDEAGNVSAWTSGTEFAPDNLPGLTVRTPAIDPSTETVTLAVNAAAGTCVEPFYEFQIDTQSDFSTAQTLWDSLATNDIASVTLSGLNDRTVYYWRARAVAPGGASAGPYASTSFFLDYSLGSGCLIPALVSPTPDSTLITGSVQLTVENVDTDSTNVYFFEISVDDVFSQPYATGVVPQQAGDYTSWTVDEVLTPGATYYWRASVNACDFSASQAFSLDDMELAAPRAYPNPVNFSEYAEVSLTPVPLGATVTITSTSGNFVRQWTAAEDGIAYWDGRNDSGQQVASGIYLWYVKDTGTHGKIVVVR